MSNMKAELLMRERRVLAAGFIEVIVGRLPEPLSGSRPYAAIRDSPPPSERARLNPAPIPPPTKLNQAEVPPVTGGHSAGPRSFQRRRVLGFARGMTRHQGAAHRARPDARDDPRPTQGHVR